MTKRIRIAIVLSDALHRIGLKSLFIEYFSPIDVVCYSSFRELATQKEMYNLYFTDAENFVLGSDFFLLRKSKTCMLFDSERLMGNSIHILPCNASKEALIDCLEPLLENVTDAVGESESSKKLSSREIDVLKQIVKGRTNKEVGEFLNISLNTVLTHRKNITAKLGIKTVPGLTFYAITNGIITGDEI